MRPLRLELRGFTSFREPQVIDFTDRRLFAITGPTGAGKTSILDAMTWALFGRVPRVGNKTRQLIHHGAQVMSVRFDFDARGETYRVSRQAPAATGTRLERLRPPGETWERIADRANEVTAEVQRILGLSYDTFTKTVFLPQGQFDLFLRGEPKERREVLTSLLGLDVYRQMQGSARNQAAGLGAAAAVLGQRLERIAHPDPAAVAQVAAALGTLERQAQAARERRERLEAIAERAREQAEAQRTHQEAERAAQAAAEQAARALAALTEADGLHASTEQQIAATAAALAALAYDEAAHRELERRVERAQEVARAHADADAAQQRLDAATATVEQQATASAASAAALATAEAEQATKSAALHQAATSLSASADHARACAEALEARQRARETQRAAAEQQASAEQARAQHFHGLAARIAQATTDHAQATEALTAATAQEAAATAAREAAAAERDAATVARDAAHDAREAVRRAHAAAALRAGLRLGEDCPICGEPIERLDAAQPPDLATAEAALREAEAMLTTARQQAEHATATAAAATASAEAAATSAHRATEHLTTIRSELLPLDLPTDATPEQIAAAATGADAAAAAASEQIAAIDAGTQAHHDLARRLDRTLARLPADLPPADAPVATVATVAEPDAIDSEVAAAAEAHLAAAVEAHLTATATAAAAQQRVAAAAAAAREDAARLEHAHAQQSTAAQQAQAQAARLDELSGAPGVESGGAAPDSGHDVPQAMAARLDVVRAAAIRDRELRQHQQEANATLAAAAATQQARREAVATTEAAATAAREQADGAAATVTALLATLAEAWRAAGGDGGDDGGAAPFDTPFTTPFTTSALETERAEAETDDRRIGQELGAMRERHERAQQEVIEATQMRSEIERQRTAASRLETMSRELQADRFVAFVQREAMQVLAHDASTHLHRLSRNRYRLTVQADEFYVIDGFNGDEARSVKTLSGGETFLASLALALALSERLPELAGAGGAMSLEALFLDEGFGSLDAEALEVAIEGLELLSDGQRVIGVISHVPAVAARLTDRIVVEQHGGTSVITQGEPTYTL